MKTRFDEIGYPLYCDAGPHEGDMRVDLTLRLYLSPQEYARYHGPESLQITLGEPGEAGGTAEPSTGRAVAPRARAGRARRPRVRLHREGAQRWPSLNPVTTRPPASGSKATRSSP